eukprot:CAMPEP_0114539016 /NCGR_PEP_ID=MMETSP0114-20121206/15_1 /TAXON_ID=31324 /ORGANISM="Goniomonas sp, Strain m" /LENGTH=278 /DNA_ID=CAMNT_0001723095 /DNA_START=725 /DNA_END=1561 /DNA_ORIENTATION=-
MQHAQLVKDCNSFRNYLHLLVQKWRGKLHRGEADLGNNLLTYLIQHQDKAFAEGAESLSDIQIVDNLATFLFAGADTTAATLTWTLSNLLHHPHVLEKLQTEVDDVMGTRPPTEAPTQEDVNRMPYLLAVIKETLRIIPPAAAAARVVPDENQEIGGRRVRKGDVVLVMYIVAQNKEEAFDSPNQFLPERFLPDPSVIGANKGGPFAYTPFSAGPRRCIGEKFAMLEMRLVVAALIRRYRMELEPGQKVVKMAEVVIKPKTSIMVRFHPRIDSSKVIP